MFYGLISGLGFGIKEGVGYQLGPYAAEAAKTGHFAAFYLESVLRLTSLPFFHAVWTGIAAYLIWFAARLPSARAGLLVLALVIPATYHGLYDALVDRSPMLLAWSSSASAPCRLGSTRRSRRSSSGGSGSRSTTTAASLRGRSL